MVSLEQKIKNKNSGFTLVEALVFLFIFSIIVITFYSVLTSGTGYIIESKNRLNALALANEKMEIIRNLNYEDIGTINGIPEGSIAETEDAISGGRTFNVKTTIQYVDDAHDDVAPADDTPNDYKRAKITISWEGFKGLPRSVYLVSNFTPPGLEADAGDGILGVSITDGTGAGISQASVHIVNSDVSPSVDVTQNTNNSGILMFPGAKESQYGYQMTVSKDGYENVSTIDPYSVTYLPRDPHASVVAGLLSTAAITIDKLSDLKIKSIDHLGNTIPSVSFHIKGGREIGTDSLVIPPEVIYNLDSDESTDSGGEKDFNDHSPGGKFFLSDIETVPDHTLIGAYPLTGFDNTASIYKFSLLPDESRTVEVKFAVNSADSLLVKVLNNDDDSRISGAQVRLTNVSGFGSDISTSFDGIAFFPESADLLLPGEYTLEISHPDFQGNSETINISQLTTKEIKLSPQE